MNTRSYIYFAVNILSQFQMEPRHDDWITTKHILRYIRGTLHYCLKYDGKNNIQLMGYTCSDWRGSETVGRSTIGGCFILGSSMISWISRNQESLSFSSVEVEYIATCEVGRVVV